MKGKDPAFLLYPLDMLLHIAELDLTEIGAYTTLMLYQHGHGPLSEKLIKKHVGELSTETRNCFETNQEGKLFLKWVESAKDERKASGEKQRQRANSRWDKVRAEKNKKEQTNNNSGTSLAYAAALPLTKDRDRDRDRDKDIDIDRTKVELYPTFEDFWDLYDKKSGSRRKTEAKFKSLPHKIKMEIIDHLDQYIPSTPDKQFRKDPITYLNNEGWEQEIIKQNQNESRNKNNTDYSELKALVQSANF